MADDVQELLERLRSDSFADAWHEFLEIYSPLLQKVADRFGSDPDDQANCFLFVCESLAADRYRRILAFKVSGPASFKSWITAVVTNLCIDWFRSEHGRPRPFSKIAELPAVEIQTFRTVFEQGMSSLEAFEVVKADFPTLTGRKFSAILERLYSLLSSQQHWRLLTQRPALRSIERDDGSPRTSASIEPSDARPNPERVASRREQRRLVEAALVQLSRDERLLIRLRFQAGLTLREVGRATGLGDPFKARHKVDRAVAKLSRSVDTLKQTDKRKGDGKVREEKVDGGDLDSDG
jgi:RNA polymerase sigma factor (sigma-70 family)